MKKFKETVFGKVNKVIFTLAKDTRGEGMIDVVIKIVIEIVLGLLVLAALYLLFNQTLIPKISSSLTNMFNYGG